MRSLREARISGDKANFSDLIAPLHPVLAQGLAAARGEPPHTTRRTLGWSRLPASRGGIITDQHGAVPTRWRRRRNVYAHTMWAGWCGRACKLEGEVRQHLETPRSPARASRLWRMRSPSPRAANFNGYAPDAQRQMGAAGEQPDASQREFRLAPPDRTAAEAEREQLLGFVGPADAWATVEWLYPQESAGAGAPAPSMVSRWRCCVHAPGGQEEALAALRPHGKAGRRRSGKPGFCRAPPRFFGTSC